MITNRWPAALSLVVALAACDEPQHFKTNVQILKIRRFGQGAGVTEIELKFADCPGDAHKVLRIDRSFAACGAKLEQGDDVPADVVLRYSRERSHYRNEIARLGDCDVKIDPKDEANYELVQECHNLKATGVDVGVQCTRKRSPEMLAKCPFLRWR